MLHGDPTATAFNAVLFGGVPQSTGPMCPPIFVGHVRSSKLVSSSSNNNSIQALVSGKTDVFVDEISFASPVQIEGIHIVPLKVCPPGISIEGLTTPDINTRAFLVNLLNKLPPTSAAPEAGTAELISLTVRGGVQWHPIPAPRHLMRVRTLVLGGDFEVITIIIHGQVLPSLDNQTPLSLSSVPINTNAVKLTETSSSTALLQSDSSMSAVIVESASMMKIEESDSLDLWDLSSDQSIKSGLASLLIPNVEASSARNSIEHRKLKAVRSRFPQLVGPGLQPKLIRARAGVLGRSCKRHRESVLSLSSAANLVGELFTYEERDCCSVEEYSNKSRAMGRIAELLGACWESNLTHRSLRGSSKDSADSCIGAEAAGILSAIATSAMDPLRCDAASPLAEYGDPDLLQHYAVAVFSCVEGILMNEFTAVEFSESGGMAMLCYLLQQQAALETHLRLPMGPLLACFQRAVTLCSSSSKIILNSDSEDYSEEASTYQSLVHLLKDLHSTSAEAVQLKMILNWLALVDSLQALHEYCSSNVLNTITEIADALTWYSSKMQTYGITSSSSTTAAAAAAEESADGSMMETNEPDKLRGVLGAVERLCPSLLMRCAAVMTSLQEVRSTTVATARDGDDHDLGALLVMMLMQSRLVSSLVAAVSLVMSIEELSCSLEWTCSSDSLTSNMQSIAQMCNMMMSQLMQLELGVLIFAAHAEQVQLLWELLSSGNQQCYEFPVVSQRSVGYSCYSGDYSDCEYKSFSLHHHHHHQSYREHMNQLYHRLWSANYSNLTLCLFDDLIASFNQCISNHPSSDDRVIYQLNEQSIDLLKQILDQCTNSVTVETVQRICVGYFWDDVMDVVEAAVVAMGDSEVESDDDLQVQARDLLLRLVVEVCWRHGQLLGVDQRLNDERLHSRMDKVAAIASAATQYASDKKDDDTAPVDGQLKMTTMTTTTLLAEYSAARSHYHNASAAAATIARSVDSRPALERRLVETMSRFDLSQLRDSTATITTAQQLVAAVKELTLWSNCAAASLECSSVLLLLQEILLFVHRLCNALCSLYDHYGATVMHLISQLDDDDAVAVSARDGISLNISSNGRGGRRGGGLSGTSDDDETEKGAHRIIHRSLWHLIAVSIEALWMIVSAAYKHDGSMEMESAINTRGVDRLVSMATVVYSLSEVLHMFVPCSLATAVGGDDDSGSDEVSLCLEATTRSNRASISILQLLFQRTASTTTTPPPRLAIVVQHGLKHPPCLEMVMKLLSSLLPDGFHSMDAYYYYHHASSSTITTTMDREEDTDSAAPINRQMLHGDSNDDLDDDDDVQFVVRRAAVYEDRNQQRWTTILHDNNMQQSDDLSDSMMTSMKQQLLPAEYKQQLNSLFRSDASLDALVASLELGGRPIDHDPLYRGTYYRVNSLATILLAGLWSTSQSLHSRSVSLAYRCLAIDLDESHAICSSIVASFTWRVARYHQQISSSSSSSATPSTEQLPGDSEDGPYDEERDRKALCRFIVSTIHLCDNNALNSFLFVRSGVLLPLFLALRFKVVSISILSLQCITALYKSMMKLLAMEKQASTEGVTAHQQASSFTADLSSVLDTVSAGLSELLAIVLRSFQRIHNLGLVALQQGALTLSLLPTAYLLCFVNNLSRVGEGVSLEFMAIKIWGAFDESYESLNDLTNQLKAVRKEMMHGGSREKGHSTRERERKASSKATHPQHSSEPELLAMINKSHRKLHSSTASLHAIVRIVLLAYTEGWIGLSAVHKAFRTAQHGDPKKALVRCQKGYVMWLNAITSMSMSMVDHSHGGDATAAASDSMLRNRSSALYRSPVDALSSLSLDQILSNELLLPTERRLFDSRHACISNCLKLLVEEMNLFARYASAREEKYALRREPPQLLLSQSGRQLSVHRDMVDPFRASSHPYPCYHRIWFNERMKRGSRSSMCDSPMVSMDLLARDLRQIIEGPAITENSSYHGVMLSDKKMTSSIYVGGWLWEGFREVQRMHLKEQQQQQQQQREKEEKEKEEQRQQQVKALQEASVNRKRSLSNQQQQDHPLPAATLHPATTTVASNQLLIPPSPMAAQAAYGFMNGFPVPAYYSGQMMGQYRPPPPVFMGQQIGPAPTGTGAVPPY